VTGAGAFPSGTNVALKATANVDWEFFGWLENGVTVSQNSGLNFTASSSRALTASFLPVLSATRSTSNIQSLTWPADADGWLLQESADMHNWNSTADAVSVVGAKKSVTPAVNPNRCFYRLVKP
jgi:hypothetical protein